MSKLRQLRDTAETVKVANLATEEYFVYVGLDPIQSLISAAMLADGICEEISDPVTRSGYWDKITWGTKTIAIGDLCCLRERKK